MDATVARALRAQAFANERAQRTAQGALGVGIVALLFGLGAFAWAIANQVQLNKAVGNATALNALVAAQATQIQVLQLSMANLTEVQTGTFDWVFGHGQAGGTLTPDATVHSNYTLYSATLDQGALGFNVLALASPSPRYNYTWAGDDNLYYQLTNFNPLNTSGTGYLVGLSFFTLSQANVARATLPCLLARTCDLVGDNAEGFPITQNELAVRYGIGNAGATFTGYILPNPYNPFSPPPTSPALGQAFALSSPWMWLLPNTV